MSAALTKLLVYSQYYLTSLSTRED
jgi:hypothetical protein